MATSNLHVRIVSTRELILDTQAQSVSSRNQQGKFDVLPQHANFITVVENTPIIIRKKGQERLSFQYPIAIIYVYENKVNIYTYTQTNN